MSNKIKIANAPCSWGALEFALDGSETSYEQVLDELVETGYAGTELGDWGFMPTDPEQLHEAIARRNISLVGAFVPVAMSNEKDHASGVQHALTVARLMSKAGYREAFIVLADANGTVEYRTKNAGRTNGRGGLSAEEMKIFAAGAEKVARAVKETFAMRTVFHHHCAGYIETPEEISTFLQAADPGLVGLCFDTGHYMFGGGKNPLDILERYWDRIWHVHFKDFSSHVAALGARNNWDYFESVQHGVFCDLGKGDVNFDAVIQFLRNKDYQGWVVVEQDVLPGMGHPKQCAANNRTYLRQKGL